MKKVKKLYLIIACLIMCALAFNEEMVKTSARDYNVTEVQIGDIYKSGDVVIMSSPTPGYDMSNIYIQYQKEDSRYTTTHVGGGSGVRFPAMNGKQVLFEVEGITGTTYYGFYTINVKIIDKKLPEVSLECDKTSIKYGESAICDLKVKYYHAFTSLNFKFDSEKFKVNKIEATNNYEAYTSSGKYIIEADELDLSATISNPKEAIIAKINVTAKENINLTGDFALNNVNTTDIYTESGSSDSHESISKNLASEAIEITEPEPTPEPSPKPNPVNPDDEENPKTGIMDYTFIVIGLIAVGIFALKFIDTKSM